jgi:hypothetical protein
MILGYSEVEHFQTRVSGSKASEPEIPGITLIKVQLACHASTRLITTMITIC